MTDPVVLFAWRDLLASDSNPPEVRWVDGQPCRGLSFPAIPIGDSCAAGLYARGVVTLVRMPGSIANTGLCHEMMHASLEERTGDLDAGHVSDDWQRIPEMNTQIRSAGY